MFSRKKSLWRGVALLAGAAALTATGITSAYSAPGGGEPPPDETAANNLSVPAIFVPSVGVAGPTCTDADDSYAPTGDTSLLHPGYYLQGESLWQADCSVAAVDTVSAAAEWGDNLTNAPLKAGTPIRVEIGFQADPATYPMTGFTVIKLDPELADRLSHYGTNGNPVSPYPEVRVWDAGVTLRIASGAVVVADNIPYTAEINSTGRVVYGFNWQKPIAGEYTVTVTAPTISLTSADAGTVVDPHTVTLTVNVGNKGGGGSGGGGRPPRGGGGGGGPRPH